MEEKGKKEGEREKRREIRGRKYKNGEREEDSSQRNLSDNYVPLSHRDEYIVLCGRCTVVGQA